MGCGATTTTAAPTDAGPAPATMADSASPADAAPAELDASPAPLDSSAPIIDAAVPVCPAVYSVYGDGDASDNLGDVNPTLYASGTCGGPTEQYSAGIDGGAADGGIASTDLTITLAQSAPRSGMFVTVIHQSTPFPFEYTTCLESAGHGTGSAPGPGLPGTIALVNDAETVSFPQVQLGTNFAGDDLLFDVSLNDTAMFELNSVSCTFVKN
jgi:hypothetical protein